MYHSVKFSIFTDLSNHYQNLIIQYCHPLRKKPVTTGFHFPNTLKFQFSLVWKFLINGIRQYIIICDWPIIPSVNFSRSIRVVACINSSLHFIAEDIPL